MNEWLEIIKKRKKHYGNNEFKTNSIAKNEIGATLQAVDSLDGNITKCPKCLKILSDEELSINNKLCKYCYYHFKISSIERAELIFDTNSIEFFYDEILSSNIINFPNYDKKLMQLQEKLDIDEAVITGKGNIFGNEIYFGIMDYRFIMGSMGSIVGEKLTRMIEKATENKKPIIIFSASGGARMQEGMISLYQMAKVIAAIDKHSEEGLLYISVLTDPTTGGVMASFAAYADIIIAEPNATIGFAGKRVKNNASKEVVPDNFQTSEFHLENGHIDMICHRNELKNKLFYIINIYKSNNFINKEKIDFNKIINNERENCFAWDKVKLARDPDRLGFNEYIDNVFDNFIELSGDRISSDDKAIVCGIGYINGIPITAIFSAKGKTLNENIVRNFGMARPEGYRKVIRVSKLSEKFHLPVVLFVDTPGACCDVKAEKMGQSYAIASSIKNLIGLKTPIISIICGEGGSGGALALGVADWIYIMENGIYSVISPEGCAAILFKNKEKVKECSEYLKLTSHELLKLKIVDEIIYESVDDKNLNKEKLLKYIKAILTNKIIELNNIETTTLLSERYNKFRDCGREFGNEKNN